MTFLPLISNSDSPTGQIFYQFYDLVTDIDIHRITCSFHGAFATSVVLPHAYASGHLVSSPFLGLAYSPIVDTRASEIAVSFHDFLP